MKRTKLKRTKKSKFGFKLFFKFIALFAVVGMIFATISYFKIYLPAKKIQASAQNLMVLAKDLKTVAKENDMDLIVKKFGEIESAYDSFEKDASAIFWTKNIPYFGKYGADFLSGVTAGRNMLLAGKTALTAVTPYADLIGFKKGGPSLSDKSADDRLASAVLTLDKLTGSVDEIADLLDKAEKEIENIDPADYPEKIGERPVRERMTQILTDFESGVGLFVNARDFVKQLPTFLGAREEKTYLFWFQNDTELRPTGGFLTAYAIFKVKQGRIEVVKSEDIYSLDAGISRRPPTPKEILTYHKGVSTYFIRDSNLSPDFPTSVKLFETLYNAGKETKDYDAIITIDTQVLVDTIRILGETGAGGKSFKADTDPRCDCPQVIYELLDEVDRPVGYVKADRKGILGDLLYEVMKKALGSSPSQYWGPLAKEMIRDMQEKHILLNFKDSVSQKAIEKINFGGKINETKGDYLHISDTNFAGAKSNLFVQHSVMSKTKFEGSKITRELEIEYKNPHKHSDCNLERGGLCLNATLRNWFRIYVPKGSTLTSLIGSIKPTRTYEDLGYTVFEGYNEVMPEGKASVKVKYTLPTTIESNKDKYSLLIQKQPGTKGHSYSVNIAGKTKKVKLTSDMTFSGK